MSLDLEPWDKDVLALLDEGKPSVEPSGEARARLEHRLDLAIAKEAIVSSTTSVRLRPRSVVIGALALAASVAIGFAIGRSKHADQNASNDKSHPTRTYVPPSSSGNSFGALSSNGQELLDDAVARLNADDPGGALDRLDEHARKHPTGPLTELREALSIEALARAGRKDEARDRGAKFFARYPKSLLAPAVNDALARISDG